MEKTYNLILDQLKNIITECLKQDSLTIIKVNDIVNKTPLKNHLINLKNIKTEDQFIKSLSCNSLLDTNDKIKRSSIIQYINKIKILHLKLFDNPIDFGNMNFLRDHKKIINYIYGTYGSSNSSAFSNFIALTSICRRLADYQKEAEIYNKEMIKQRDIIHERQGDNSFTDKELKNYIEWQDILNHKPPQDVQSIAIYTLYTSLPPRRLDYQYMIVKFGNHNINNLSENYNYYLPDQNLLVFKKYKTYKIYKTQIINLLDKNTSYANYNKILKCLKELVKNKKDNDFLFVNKKNDQIKNFTNIIKNVFQVIDKKPTVNILRHSFLSSYTSKIRTSNILEKVSYMMAHSVSTQSRYRKLDKFKIIFD